MRRLPYENRQGAEVPGAPLCRARHGCVCHAGVSPRGRASSSTSASASGTGKPIGDTLQKAPEDNHTFLFVVDRGIVIDAGTDGNDARFINHGCDPNCESVIEDRRVFIDALRTIQPGEELKYDYSIARDRDDPANVDEVFACHCGVKQCRGTMLWPAQRPKPRRRRRRAAQQGRQPAHAALGTTRMKPKRLSLRATFGAVGVVFGDIGTSPLYALEQSLNATGADRHVPGGGARRAVADLLEPADRCHGQVRDPDHARGQRGRGRHPLAVCAGAALAGRDATLGPGHHRTGGDGSRALLLRRADHAGHLGARRGRGLGVAQPRHGAGGGARDAGDHCDIVRHPASRDRAGRAPVCADHAAVVCSAGRNRCHLDRAQPPGAGGGQPLLRARTARSNTSS